MTGQKQETDKQQQQKNPPNGKVVHTGIPELGRLQQVDHAFKAHLGYSERSCLKTESAPG